MITLIVVVFLIRFVVRRIGTVRVGACIPVAARSQRGGSADGPAVFVGEAGVAAQALAVAPRDAGGAARDGVAHEGRARAAHEAPAHAGAGRVGVLRGGREQQRDGEEQQQREKHCVGGVGWVWVMGGVRMGGVWM